MRPPLAGRRSFRPSRSQPLKVRIHLVHGIRTSGSNQPPEALIPYLPPAVYYPDYGYELALATRVLNPMIEGAIAPYIEPGDVMIGHSNGCAIIYDLLQKGAQPSGVVFINGALEQVFALPACVQWCDVYFNPGDTITEAAKVAAKLGLVDLCWGELGHAGYAGSDPRVTNINTGNTRGFPIVEGHSAIFSSTNLPVWGPYIAQRIAAPALKAA